MLTRESLSSLLASTKPGHTLAREFYTSPEIYQFDIERVFPRCWLFAGFSCELREPGSYCALSVGSMPVLLVRGNDGRLRGFHNTCRHRGSKICADGTGRASRLVCPYHKWTYDLEGRLRAAPRMMEQIDRDSYPLASVRTEEVEGCIYVALTDAAPDFAPFREALAPRLAPYSLARAKVAATSTLVERANWKLVVENARECLHCVTAHPELGASFPTTIGRNFDFETANPNNSNPERMKQLGLDMGLLSGSWWNVGRYPLNQGAESISMTGRAVVAHPLSDANTQLGGFRWATEPNSFCHALADYAFSFSVLPVGPTETIVASKWLVNEEAVEGRDYNLEALTEVWTATNQQDRTLAENNQLGVNSIGYRSGPYSAEAEDFVVRFSDWYRAMVDQLVNPVSGTSQRVPS